LLGAQPDANLHRSSLSLQVTLTENWLIFITRSANGLLDTYPSWQLVAAVLAVDILATLFAIFGWFSGVRTDIVTVVRIWVYAVGVTAVISIIYYALNNSSIFSNLVRGKISKKNKNLEDFMANLELVSAMHEQSDRERVSSGDKNGNARVRKPISWKDEDDSAVDGETHLAAPRVNRSRKLSVDPDLSDSESEDESGAGWRKSRQASFSKRA
jgi:hypothetical protein